MSAARSQTTPQRCPRDPDEAIREFAKVRENVAGIHQKPNADGILREIREDFAKDGFFESRFGREVRPHAAEA